MEIKQINPIRARRLVEALDTYQSGLYPAESNHLEPIESLTNKNVIMLGALHKECLFAMGAVKLFKNYGEIKRLFVPEKHRGKGLAQKIMAELEDNLIQRSIFTARLETGIYQPEAVGLYKKLGYVLCDPFGDYKPDPLSVFMEKQLSLRS